MPKPIPEPRRDFRFPLMERILLGSTAVLIWILLLGGVGLVASLVPGPEWMVGVFLFAVLALFTLLANVIVRDFLMKLKWRLTLGDGEVMVTLPAHRLLFGRQPAFSGTIPLAEIKAVEWREEATESFEIVTINRVYALRLKDGSLIMLGEDRPVPRTDEWTSNMHDAAQALSRALGIPMRRLQMARGKGGVLTLWGASRPDWPNGESGGMSVEEERAVYRQFRMTNLIPVATLIIVLLVLVLTG